MGAMNLGQSIGIKNSDFLTAMSDFTGAGKRLQKVIERPDFVMFKDFAHSPSKLKATTAAVKHQYPSRKVVACMELHTFSSLKKEFLPHYEGAMMAADEALVYFNPEVVHHKKLEPISVEQVSAGFGGGVHVKNETADVLSFIRSQKWNNAVLLMMSSGNFDGIDYDQLGTELCETL
jgi:UDP-N-acetylmuramate: L-alanyl-gamma-D-glutamyl-meso-diaminopimelate ligase